MISNIFSSKKDKIKPFFTILTKVKYLHYFQNTSYTTLTFKSKYEGKLKQLLAQTDTKEFQASSVISVSNKLTGYMIIVN